MPSQLHEKILMEKIEEYQEKGYDLLSKNSKVYQGYQPDAIVRNNEEVVVVEVVVTSDNTHKFNEKKMESIFGSPVRLDITTELTDKDFELGIMPKVRVDQFDVKKVRLDHRGRGYVGSEYADKIVSIVVLSVEDKD